MTNSPPLNLLLLLAFLVLESALLIAIGEAAARALARTSLWRARLPELAFLTGYAAFSVIGYAALPFTISAKGILLAAILAALTAYAYAIPHRDLTWLNPYLEFRRTSAFRFAAAGFLLYAALITAYRTPWLLQLSIGTMLWDDSRTLGFPIALAAHGFPLRSPLADGMLLSYPLGAFLYPATMIAWVPSVPLPILLADVAAQAAFYSLTVLILVAVLFHHPRARAIAFLAATLSVSFNLFVLNPRKGSWWLENLYGYYRNSGQTTTIGWTPFLGLLWIPNHAIAFCSVLLAAFWLLRDDEDAPLGMPILFAVFAAATSADFTIMPLVAVILILLARAIRRPSAAFNDRLIRRALWLCAAAASVFVLANLPAIRGLVDAPFDPVFPLNTNLLFTIGFMGGNTLPYLLLILAGCLALRKVGFPLPWLAVLLTGFVFAFVFEFHSIWSWRFTFASHVLFGFALAWQYEKLSAAARKWLFAAALIAFVPGLAQIAVNAAETLRSDAYTSPQRAQTLNWIYAHTPLWARVAEYRLRESSLATDPNFLRVGNRGGSRVYDRSHPLIGYPEYKKNMTDLAGALASNDFVVVPFDTPALARALDICGPPRFANKAASIFEITPGCRNQLVKPDTHSRIEWLQRMLRAESLIRTRVDYAKVPLHELRDIVILDPDKAFHIRHRADKLWEKGEFNDLIPALESILAKHPNHPEMNYSLAFSLHISGKDTKRAIEHYTRALANGYDPFWGRYNRGAALAVTKQLAAARQDLQAAHALNPKHEGVNKLLATIGGR
ncbi:MAG: hypothetical protein HY820_07340 [Acidobacteria bacterium]|nr:hypothetical protein [Acidobacteriota bacterium]